MSRARLEILILFDAERLLTLETMWFLALGSVEM